jgi:hypothetical protein
LFHRSGESFMQRFFSEIKIPEQSDQRGEHMA